jgi:hypothetical protein
MPQHTLKSVKNRPNFISFLCVGVFAADSGMSNAEMKAYLAGCKKALSQAKPDWNPKDVNMICADPYLKGKPNESKEDRARRMRLIEKTNKDKERMFDAAMEKQKSYLENCKSAFELSNPNKDPKDVDLLCHNPYLTPSENESADDKERRLRLINETDAAKEKALDQFVVPQQPSGSAP